MKTQKQICPIHGKPGCPQKHDHWAADRKSTKCHPCIDCEKSSENPKKRFTARQLQERIKHKCTDFSCSDCHALHDHDRFKCIPCRGDKEKKPKTKTWLVVMEVTTPLDDDGVITENRVREEFEWLADSDAYDGSLQSMTITHCVEVKK